MLTLGLATFAALAAEPFTSENIVYKKVGSRKLLLHLEKPAAWKSADQHPAIVFYFGGGWLVPIRSSSKFRANIWPRAVWWGFMWIIASLPTCLTPIRWNS